MVRRDRPSFPTYFKLHLQRLLPLVDHLYVRIDKTGEDVTQFLEPYGDKIHWEWQHDHPHNNHLEHLERQAILDWGLSTNSDWMFCFDSDEVLEEGAAEQIREFLEAGAHRKYRILMFPLTYCSHHRHDTHVLDRDETSVSSGRGFVLRDRDIREFKYVGDSDGLHCGTLPGQERRSAAILKEIVTFHHHACTPEEWEFKRAFYDDTEEVRKHGGIDVLYPHCGEPPYDCVRFGAEKNAVPIEDALANKEERFATLMRRIP